MATQINATGVKVQSGNAKYPVIAEQQAWGQAIPTAYATVVGVVPQVPTAVQVLDQSSGFFIRQKAQWFEEVVGFEQANKYKICK